MRLVDALALASYVGMPWRFARAQDWWTPPATKPRLFWSWSGHELVVPRRRSWTDTLHEVCHWLTASPRMRKWREFGLGRAPFADVLHPDGADYRAWDADQREIEACVLELLLREAACSREVARRRAKLLNMDVKRGMSIREGLPAAWDATAIPEGDWFEPQAIARLAAVMREASEGRATSEPTKES